MIKLITLGRKMLIEEICIDFCHQYKETPKGYTFWISSEDQEEIVEQLEKEKIDFSVEIENPLGKEYIANIRHNDAVYKGRFIKLADGQVVSTEKNNIDLLYYLHSLTFANV